MSKSDDNFEEPAPSFNPDAPLLTPAEIKTIKEKARANILKAKKKDAEEKLLAAEEQRLRNEEGLTTGSAHADEIVSVTIDLAQFSSSIVINQRPYWHGHTYSVPRHVAETLREQMYRTWGHQAEIDGKSRSQFYAEKHVAELYKPGSKASATLSAKGL